MKKEVDKQENVTVIRQSQRKRKRRRERETKAKTRTEKNQDRGISRKLRKLRRVGHK